jgi:hypothetical protein
LSRYVAEDINTDEKK